MTGHWQILGGHPGGMGPKKKRKGQYSPFVDYTEPKKWRKKMDTGKGPSGMNFHEHISKLFEQRFSKLFEEYIREAEEEKEEGETTEEQPQEPQEDDSEEGRVARDIAAHQEEEEDEEEKKDFIERMRSQEEEDEEKEEDSAPVSGRGITAQDLEDKEAHLSKKAEHIDRLEQIISDAWHSLSPEDKEYFLFIRKGGEHMVKRTTAKDSDQRGRFSSEWLSQPELIELLKRGGKLEEFQNEYAQYEKKPSPRVAATLGRGRKQDIYQDTQKMAAQDQKKADKLQQERGERDVDIDDAGYNAGLKDESSIDDCEYPELTKQYDMWMKGYEAGRKEKAANRPNRHRK